MVSQHAILPEDVKKIIEAADRDDYPAIVVGEHHLAIHHYTDEVYEIFAKGLGVDCEIFLTDVNELGDEQVLQVTPFCSVEQEALLMPTLRNCHLGQMASCLTDITAADADKGKGLHAMADYLGLNIEETMLSAMAAMIFHSYGRQAPVLQWAMQPNDVKQLPMQSAGMLQKMAFIIIAKNRD